MQQMQESDPTRKPDEEMEQDELEEPQDEGPQDEELDDAVIEEDEESVDWMVFLLRAAALITFGATLFTAVDLSRNQDVEWLTVLRLSILPFVGGVLVLAAAEIVDRQGD